MALRQLQKFTIRIGIGRQARKRDEFINLFALLAGTIASARGAEKRQRARRFVQIHQTDPELVIDTALQFGGQKTVIGFHNAPAFAHGGKLPACKTHIHPIHGIDRRVIGGGQQLFIARQKFKRRRNHGRRPVKGGSQQSGDFCRRFSFTQSLLSRAQNFAVHRARHLRQILRKRVRKTLGQNGRRVSGRGNFGIKQIYRLFERFLPAAAE